MRIRIMDINVSTWMIYKKDYRLDEKDEQKRNNGNEFEWSIRMNGWMGGWWVAGCVVS